jgi:hypothetical protein
MGWLILCLRSAIGMMPIGHGGDLRGVKRRYVTNVSYSLQN